MTTTSVKLPDDLKARAASAAQTRGMSTHAFLVDAIRQTVDTTERRAQFVRDAVASREQAITSGQGYAAEDVHTYLRDKTQGKSAKRPKVTSWRE